MSDRCSCRVSILFVIFVLFVATSHSYGQTEEKDKADGVRTARQVARYLQQTQDINLVLRKYATKNFLDGAPKDHLFNVFSALDEDVLAKLDDKTRDTYYLAASNWFYLGIVYTVTRRPKKSTRTAAKT